MLIDHIIKSSTKNSCCIYKIYCKSNKSYYYGSTYNLSKRSSDHFRDLVCNKHINPRLQNVFNKYGVDSFIIYVVKKVERSYLLNEEQKFLDIGMSDLKCLNINFIAAQPPRDTFGKRLAAGTAVPIILKNIKTGEIREWAASKLATLDTNLTMVDISCLRSGVQKSAKGWCLPTMDISIAGRQHSGSDKWIYVELQNTITNNIEKFRCISDAEKKTGISHYYIKMMLSNKKLSINNYRAIKSQLYAECK